MSGLQKDLQDVLEAYMNFQISKFDLLERLAKEAD